MTILAMDDIIQLAVKFRIGGILIYLSHAQMLRLFQRACTRAQINLLYSQGMNPHPKMSLPLPRPVAIESDDELLTMRIHNTDEALNNQEICDNVKDKLSQQLPAGFDLISVNITEPGRSFVSAYATYIIHLRAEAINDRLRIIIENILKSESLVIKREILKHSSTDKKVAGEKTVDVRRFLKSIELCGTDIIAVCEITSAGAIHPREIMELLELDNHKLSAPIKRTNVKWWNVCDDIQHKI
jgi:radical SAM-linked protein